jgi:3-deoxy-D-manno-octulosonic-acid transferase
LSIVAINVSPVTSVVYRAAWTLALPLARLAALGPGKLGRTLRGRLAGRRQLVAWSVASRDTKRPLVWFHAASVGEGRQAESVMAELRRQRPAWQIAYTFSSASAEKMAAALPADVAAFLPPDTPADTGAVLDALAPVALVFSATDVWPELVAQARARRVPVALIVLTPRLAGARAAATRVRRHGAGRRHRPARR